MGARQVKTPGVLISFEGGDGSGKGTQSKLYAEYLQSQGVPVFLSGFPRYDTPTGALVGAMLRGEFGSSLDPRLGGALFSFDRLAAKDELLDHLNRGFVIILDRYVDSNKGHQGGKFKTDAERLAYFDEIDVFEIDTLGLPRPTKTILFPMPATLAQEHVDKKMARSYTDKKRDIHEADPEHLRNANEAYLLLASHEPERFVVIDPVVSNQKRMRPIDDIHTEVKHALNRVVEAVTGKALI